MNNLQKKQTHFGFQNVEEDQKAKKVDAVFDSVAPHYDLMNDLMSCGLHRLWKWFVINQAAVRAGNKVLDIAAGSGDLTRALRKRIGQMGEVWLSDRNASMLELGRSRLLDEGMIVPTVQCDAEQIPFPSQYFDLVTVAFGLRNMTHKSRALSEMQRVLKPGGRLLVLEFSKIIKPLEKIYAHYSFKVLPWLGKKIAGDAASYRYLAESICKHSDQETLKQMMLHAGFDQVNYFNLSAGIAAVHKGIKF